MQQRIHALLLISGLFMMTGCASTKTSNTARTAKEQMLLSNAIDRSLDKVDFTPLHQQKVFIEEKYLECIDKPYVVGSVRHRVMRAGAEIVDKQEDSNLVLELRSGGVGTDTSESFLGTPEIALPGMLTIPEIRLTERKTQFGYSKLGIVMYETQTRQALGDGGMAMARSDDNNWYVFGVGPFQNGTLKRDVSRAASVSPGMYRRELPTTVALGTPPLRNEDAQIQFASEARQVPPASE